MSRQSEISLLATPPVGTFNAILWKELHDNLKWAIAGLMVLAAGLTYEIQRVLSDLQSGYSSLAEIDSLFTATTFGCALIGALLGLAQSIPENRGDKWGFLAHRPTSRSVLFNGKAIAGLILYTIATSLPTAAAVGWLLLPGHIPMPLDWHIALPYAADLLCGVVFYFAALHTGMRDARWFGTRAFSLGAGVVCAVLSRSGQFSVAVAIAMAGIVVVGTAARATFLSGGRYESQPRSGRAAVALSVGCGFIVAAAVVIGIVTSFVESHANGPYAGYVLTSEGEIAQIQQQDAEILEVRDLNGRPIETYQNGNLRQKVTAGVKSSERLWLGKTFDRLTQYRSTDSMFVRVHAFVGGSRSWFYVYGSGLIAEYSNRSAELAGWFGPDGFSSGPAKPRGFGNTYRPNDSAHDTVYTFADGVYQIDFEQRQVQKLFTPDTGESILAAGSSTPASAPENFVAIATTQRVVIQSEAGEVLFERPHAGLTDKYPTLGVYRAVRAADKPFFLWYADGYMPGMGSDSHVVRLDAAGRTIQEQALAPIPQTEEAHWAEILTVLPVAPLAGRATLEIADHFRNYRQPWEATTALNAATWIIPAAFGLVFAVVTYRRGKKYSFGSRRLLLWTVLTVLLGPLAFFLMIAVVEWPATERCPSCGHHRIVTNELCEHCRQPFAPPAMDGTEIFDFGEA